MRLKYLTPWVVTVLVLSLPLGAQAAPMSQQIVHVVQWGETLSGIAWRYGLTVQALMEANHLTHDKLYAGQSLVIPTSTTDVPAEISDSGSIDHVVRRGENLSSIAGLYGVSVATIMQANGLWNADFIYTGQRLAIPGQGSPAPVDGLPETYSVQPGDTLSGIAARFGLNMGTLARLNGIVNPAFVYVGQTLRLWKNDDTVSMSRAGDKRIRIDLSEQRLYAYEGETLVYDFVISSGKYPYATRTGHFSVLNKLPNPYSRMWNVWMPNWLGIYWAGGAQNGIHALPILPSGERLWAGYLGQPASFGCIILGVDEAQQLYTWADIGTPVTVQQ